MRIELDEQGYVLNVFWGCYSGKCQLYIGTIPSGYTDLHDWSEKANINAYYLVDGNLVYDADKDYKLILQYDEDTKQYGHVTQKELGIVTAEQEKAYNDLFPSHTSSVDEIITIDGTTDYVGNLPTDEVTIKGDNITGLIELEFIGSNFLPNTATSSSNNGIDYYVETDKKITISGTSTDKSTFNLAGTDTSVKKILTFKQQDFNGTRNYFISGLDTNTNLEFYCYDGVDRTLVGTYNNGLITFDEDVSVTQVVLSIEGGKTINTTIEPMISFRNSEASYEEYKNNYTLIDLGDNILTTDDTLKLKDNKIILIKNDISSYEPESKEETYLGEEYYLGDVLMPKTYELITNVYSHQQVRLSVIYKDPRNIDITKISLKGLIQTMDIENTYNFTGTDTSKIHQYLSGNIELTQEEFELYDINGDGRVTGSDYAMMLKMKDGEIPSTIKGTFEINTTSSQRTLVLRDEEGKIKTSVGLNGITTPALSVGGISINDTLTYSEGETVAGVWIDGKTLYRKTIVFPITSTSSQTLMDATNEGFDFVTIDEAIGVNSNNVFFGNYYYTSSDFSNIYFRVKNGSPSELIYRGGSSYPKVPATLYVTLRYTKKEATDTPTADLVKTISAKGSKGHHKFTLQVNETGTSGNSSSMSYTFKLSPTSNGYDWSGWTNVNYRITYTITIGDNTYTGTIPSYDGSSTVTLKSGSGIMIEHDADGTKTLDIGFTVKDTTGATYTSGNASASDTMILTEIG